MTDRPVPKTRAATRWARPLRWIVLAYGLAMLPAACVIIPYKPSSETKHDLSEVANPGRIRLTVGSRNFLDDMAKDVLEQDKRLQRVDGQTFIDTASPTQELTLARLLDPSTRALIEPLQVDYLVVFGEPKDATLETFGDVIAYTGFFGLAKNKTSTTVWAAVIDVKQLQVVEQLTSQSVGTDAGVGLFYGLFVHGDTKGSAKKGAVRHVVETIAGVKPTGPVSVVFLADEPIPTAEEVVREARQQGVMLRRWVVGRYPEFTAAAPPDAEHGLIYVYRTFDYWTRSVGLNIRTGSAAAGTTITRLWSNGSFGGYFPFNAPVGAVTVWFDSDTTQSVTLDIQPGETYYLKASAAYGSSIGGLAIVDGGKAMKEMKKCGLMPSAEADDIETRNLAEQGFPDSQIELAVLYSTGVSYPDDSALPRDLVESYMWLSIAAQPSSAWRTLAAKSRDSVAAEMDAAQIAQAEQRARDWIEAHATPEVVQEARQQGVVDRYPEFTAAAPPDAEHGLIYIYRPYDDETSSVDLNILTGSTAAGTTITQLRSSGYSGGYFPFYAPVGAVTVWVDSDATQSVTLDIQPGETYYVKGSTAIVSSKANGRLAIVDGGKAMKEVKKCRLMPSAEAADLETRNLAEQGFPDRQIELGVLYTTGINYPDGSALPRDLVEAYMWLSVAAQDSEPSSAWRTLAAKSRHSVAAEMDAVQIAQAEQRARDWIAEFEKRQQAQ